MEHMGKIMYEVANCPGVSVVLPNEAKPWQSEAYQNLIQERRSCDNAMERTRISKQIQKLSRFLLRQHKNKKVSKVLHDFIGLDRLPKIQEYPVERKQNDAEINCDVFAKALQQIYESPDESPVLIMIKLKMYHIFVYSKCSMH